MSTRTRAKKARGQRELRPQRPPMRGWLGRGRGQSNYIQQADEWRGTTVQVCGMWPFAIGAGTPMVGVPFGRHILTGATLCCDPISWYQRANLIGNPSVFFLGRPGLGKTSAVMRRAVGLSGQGVIPLVLGDTRPDYVRMVEKLGGQVIPLGRNRGSLNVLDPGEAPDAARRLRAAGYHQAAEEVLADAQGLRLNMLVALITVLRKSAPTSREETILARGIAWLDEHHDGVPLIPDLLRVVRSAPPELREAALDRGT
ncbi:ATP/GTP-binding protein, partial [Streptomyces sp. NPDC055642]